MTYPSGDPAASGPQAAQPGDYPQPAPPLYPPAPPPGYPQGYPQAPLPPYLVAQTVTSPPAAPGRGARPSRRILLVLLVVVVLLAGGAYTVVNLPRSCGVFGGIRHGLPCEVPLPPGLTFLRTDVTPSNKLPPGETEQLWMFRVSGSSLHQVHDVYAQQLPSNGWGCVQDLTITDPGSHLNLGSFMAMHSGTGLQLTFLYLERQTSATVVADMSLVIDYATGPAPARSPC